MILLNRIVTPPSSGTGSGLIVAFYPLETTIQGSTMSKSIRLFSTILLALFVVSCGSGSPAPKAKDIPQGRVETKALEGATAAGYNGSQMRKKIDRVLDQNDERNRAIEKGVAAAASK
jgi:hypothetical protein